MTRAVITNGTIQWPDKASRPIGATFVKSAAIEPSPMPVAGPPAFDSVKVFSATKYMERDVLGDKVTAWIQSKPGIVIHELRTLQSSDSEFHCLTIIVLYRVGP